MRPAASTCTIYHIITITYRLPKYRFENRLKARALATPFKPPLKIDEVSRYLQHILIRRRAYYTHLVRVLRFTLSIMRSIKRARKNIRQLFIIITT